MKVDLGRSGQAVRKATKGREKEGSCCRRIHTGWCLRQERLEIFLRCGEGLSQKGEIKYGGEEKR